MAQQHGSENGISVGSVTAGIIDRNRLACGSANEAGIVAASGENKYNEIWRNRRSGQLAAWRNANSPAAALNQRRRPGVASGEIRRDEKKQTIMLPAASGKAWRLISVSSCVTALKMTASYWRRRKPASRGAGGGENQNTGGKAKGEKPGYAETNVRHRAVNRKHSVKPSLIWLKQAAYSARHSSAETANRREESIINRRRISASGNRCRIGRSLSNRGGGGDSKCLVMIWRTKRGGNARPLTRSPAHKTARCVTGMIRKTLSAQVNGDARALLLLKGGGKTSDAGKHGWNISGVWRRVCGAMRHALFSRVALCGTRCRSRMPRVSVSAASFSALAASRHKHGRGSNNAVADMAWYRQKQRGDAAGFA